MCCKYPSPNTNEQTISIIYTAPIILRPPASVSFESATYPIKLPIIEILTNAVPIFLSLIKLKSAILSSQSDIKELILFFSLILNSSIRNLLKSSQAFLYF